MDNILKLVIITNTVVTYMNELNKKKYKTRKLKNNKKRLPLLTIFIICIFSSSIFTGCIDQDRPKEDYEIYVTVSQNQVNNSIINAEKWFINNLNEDGYFNYLYDPTEENYSTENSMIRQLMGSRLLAELVNENQSLQTIHKKNLEYIFSNWYKEENDLGYIFYDNQSKLGAIAMALRTLIYSPFYEEYSGIAENLSNTILELQNSNGTFEAFFIKPEGSYLDDYFELHLYYYSGEAILSLIEYYIKTDNISLLDAAELSQNYYIQKYVTELDENYNPAYVPWHTISLNKLYKITQNDIYSDSIFILNDKLLEIQDIKNEETIGRFYDVTTPEYGEPHSASDAIYLEGLSYAYEIAIILNDTEHQETYSIALILGLHNIMSLQNNESDEKIFGAIRASTDDDTVRIDSTQHMIDAFKKTNDVIKGNKKYDWQYFYYPELGFLVKSKQRIMVRGNTSVWYALGIGTIAALIFVVIIYIILRRKK